jgi:hypothetical protein
MCPETRGSNSKKTNSALIQDSLSLSRDSTRRLPRESVSSPIGSLILFTRCTALRHAPSCLNLFVVRKCQRNKICHRFLINKGTFCFFQQQKLHPYVIIIMLITFICKLLSKSLSNVRSGEWSAAGA